MNLESPMHRHEWYQHLHEKTPEIEREARAAAARLGLQNTRGPLALYSGMSSCPSPLFSDVLDGMVRANREEFTSVQSVADAIRNLIKDDFDCAVVNTCEAGLRVAIDALVAPPIMRRGDSYRARMLFLYGEDADWGAAYGRPFPPRYKNVAIDRSISAGELGIEGKSLANLDTVFAPFSGGRYEVHGIRQNVVPILLDVDVDRTAQHLQCLAERHADSFSGLHAIGYDTPSYGYSARDDNGRPVLMQRLRDLARDYDVPFIVDSASAIPLLGSSRQEINGNVQLWSMDKVARAPTAGLIVGCSDLMLPIRKSLGLAGDRFGNVSSHGKAVHSAFDPGRDALAGVLTALRLLRDAPERIRRPIDALHRIVTDTLSRDPRYGNDLIITKSYELGGIEVNYARTWRGDKRGVPIFTLEDLYAQTNPISRAVTAMGVQPPPIYAGIMMLTPGVGMLDSDGALVTERAELAVAALATSIGIVCDYAGL
jgi:hypothetical protein